MTVNQQHAFVKRNIFLSHDLRLEKTYNQSLDLILRGMPGISSKQIPLKFIKINIYLKNKQNEN